MAITVDRTTYKDKSIITFHINKLPSSRFETPYYTGDYIDTKTLWLLGRFDGNPAYCFLGKLDEVRISNIIRPYRPYKKINLHAASQAQLFVDFYNPFVPDDRTIGL